MWKKMYSLLNKSVHLYIDVKYNLAFIVKD
jgi:hypothetical protein